MKSFLKSSRCSFCDTIFSKTGNMERHLITCSERVKSIHPKNVYQLSETLFEKLGSFNNPKERIKSCLKTWQFLIWNLFALRMRCIKKLKLQNRLKKVPITVSFSSNPIPEPSFLCNSDSWHLVSSFISSLEGLATQSKPQINIWFIAVETAIKVKRSSTLEQLNQRHSQRERVIDFDNDEFFNDTAEEKELSAQFLRMQKRQLIDLQKHFER